MDESKDIKLVARALNQGWPVTADHLQAGLDTVNQIIETGTSEKAKLAAVDLLRKMVADNKKQEPSDVGTRLAIVLERIRASGVGGESAQVGAESVAGIDGAIGPA